ncbi:hypothetical protein TNCV_2440771, partial [Trichonephila clavipes]
CQGNSSASLDFQKVIGALGWQPFVRIVSPGGEDAQKEFRCRKNYFALNVPNNSWILDLVIRNVVARWSGSAHLQH